MKNGIKIIVTLSIFTLISVFSAPGQNHLNVKIAAAFEQAKQEYASRSKDEKKLQFGTYELLKVSEAADTSTDAKQYFRDNLRIDKSLKADSKDRVRLMIHLRSVIDTTEILNLIKSLGGVVEETYRDFPYILCKIHPKQLRNIVSSQSVLNIKKNIEGIAQPIIGAGDTQLKADQARSQFSAQGAGVKVGVVSDGVDNLVNVPYPDELPMVTVVNAGSGNEGTAMLEIVHDLAPQADLYFYSGKSGYLSYAQAIKTLSTVYNCKIIVDDYGYCDEPYFTDGDEDLGQAIRGFIKGGGVLVSSAGNNNYYSGATPNVGVFSGTMNLGPVDNLNVFPNGQPNGQTYLTCTLDANKCGSVVLEWANKWTMPEANYGLLISDNNGNVKYSSIMGGDGSNPPQDMVDIINNTSVTQTYQIAVKWIKGSLAPVDFKITYNTFDGNKNNGTLSNEYTNNKQVYGHSGYPNVIGVAAYEASSPNAVSNYSSGGPLTMYSAENQSWTTTQDVPFITATAGVKTWIGTTKNPFDPDGKTYWPGGNPVFSGTSAAAPHIAAIAALYFSAFTTNTLENFREDLKMSADPIGGLGGSGNWNARAGYGKANALACIDRAASTVIAPTINPPSGPFSGPLDVEITSSTPNVEIRYTIDGTEPNQVTSNSYSQSFQVTPPCTVKAKAYLADKQPSATETAIYTAPPPAWISGTILTLSGQPISGVKIATTYTGDYPPSTEYFTNSQGYYSIRACYGCGCVSIEPIKQGYYFYHIRTPRNISASIEDGNAGDGRIPRPPIQEDGDYQYCSGNTYQAHFIGATCIVSGQIVSNGNPGIQVTIEGADLYDLGQYQMYATVMTDNLGYYTINVPPGTTRITPSKTGYTFAPANRTIGVLGTPFRAGDQPYWGDKLNQDFIDNNILFPPTILYPTNVTSTSFTAKWDPVDGITQYYLDVARSDDWNNLVYDNVLVENATSFSVAGLNPGTPYTYRVRSFDGRFQSLNSDYIFVRTLATISGKFTYGNIAANPIGNVNVTLTPASGTALTATSSTTDGTYNIVNVPNGQYTLTAAKTNNWGGVDVADALAAVQYFVRTLTDLGTLGYEAGDVNKSGAINSTDAYLIARRTLVNTTPFPVGSWVFTSYPPFSVNNEIVKVTDIQGRAVGDIDGSYTQTLPTGATFQKSFLVQLKSGTEKFTVSASTSASYGAVGMRIKVTSAKVASITSKLPGFMSNIDDEGVSFGWFAADGITPVQFEENEAIVTVNLTEKTGDGSNVTVESKLVDIQRTELNNNLSVSVQGNIPLVFELKQNYPNPFNPSTQIDYDLPMPGMVTLTVYNMLGQEVDRLVNEQKEAGSYTVQWMPKNLASGMYIYRIRVKTEDETITAVKRLMLLK